MQKAYNWQTEVT